MNGSTLLERLWGGNNDTTYERMPKGPDQGPVVGQPSAIGGLSRRIKNPYVDVGLQTAVNDLREA